MSDGLYTVGWLYTGRCCCCRASCWPDSRLTRALPRARRPSRVTSRLQWWVGGDTCQAIHGRARDAASDMSFNDASLDVASTRSLSFGFPSRHLLMLHRDSAKLSTSSLRHLQPLLSMFDTSSPLPGLSLPLPSPQLLTSQFRVQRASTHHNVLFFNGLQCCLGVGCTFVDSHKSSKYGIAMTIRSDRGTVQLNQRKSLTSTPITAPTTVVSVTKTIIDKPTIVA